MKKKMAFIFLEHVLDRFAEANKKLGNATRVRRRIIDGGGYLTQEWGNGW